MRAILALVGTVCVLSSCASSRIEVTHTIKGRYDATTPDAVDLLFTRPEGRTFFEIARVNAWGFAPDATAEMHAELRERAAAVGAQAVLITEEGMLKHSGGLQRWANGVAIRWGAAQP